MSDEFKNDLLKYLTEFTQKLEKHIKNLEDIKTEPTEQALASFLLSSEVFDPEKGLPKFLDKGLQLNISMFLELKNFYFMLVSISRSEYEAMLTWEDYFSKRNRMDKELQVCIQLLIRKIKGAVSTPIN